MWMPWSALVFGGSVPDVEAALRAQVAGNRVQMRLPNGVPTQQVVPHARRHGGAAVPAGALLRQQLAGVPAAVPAAGGAAARLCRRCRRLGCVPPLCCCTLVSRQLGSATAAAAAAAAVGLAQMHAPAIGAVDPGYLAFMTSVSNDERASCFAGFSDATFAADPATQLGPRQKREHLHAFVQQQVRAAQRSALCWWLQTGSLLCNAHTMHQTQASLCAADGCMCKLGPDHWLDAHLQTGPC